MSSFSMVYSILASCHRKNCTHASPIDPKRNQWPMSHHEETAKHNFHTNVFIVTTYTSELPFSSKINIDNTRSKYCMYMAGE